MDESIRWHENKLIDDTVKSLEKNGFEAIATPNRQVALSSILDRVPAGATVGLGGSISLRELNLPAALKERGNDVADHWEARKRGVSAGAMAEIRHKHPNSDVFITSTNALTRKGELVNIDGAGQRVAAMIYGPKKVIIVSGRNKIVECLDEAIDRVRNVAAPINAKRLGRKTPCAETGRCSDCDSPDRICSVTTIMHKKPEIADITVIVVDDVLGY